MRLGGGAKGETIKLLRSVYLYTEPKSSNKIKQSSYIFFFLSILILILLEMFKSTFHKTKSDQKYITKKFLLHLLFDNLPSFFSKTAYGRFYFNFKSALFP